MVEPQPRAGNHTQVSVSALIGSFECVEFSAFAAGLRSCDV